MTLNKRKRSRVPFDVDVHFDTANEQIRSRKLQDISMSGLYFLTDTVVPLETTGTIKIMLESGEQTIIITANGKVTRSVSPEINLPGGLGVEFTEIDTDSSIHLFNVIRYQLGDDPVS